MIIRNIITLNIIYVAKLVFPLVLLPILSVRLSRDGYGLYMYSISTAMWLSIFVEYGFNIYSTREISSEKHIHSLPVVIGTQSAKVILSGILLPICFILSFQLHIFKGNEFWAAFTWLLAVFIGFSPVYYFQGIERLKTVAFVELASNVFLLTSVWECNC